MLVNIFVMSTESKHKPNNFYRVKNLKKMKDDELKEFLDWFINIHPFSEKLYSSVPERLKKYFESYEKNNEIN